MNFYPPVCILKTYSSEQLAGEKDAVETKRKVKKSLNSFKYCFPELPVAGITYLNWAFCGWSFLAQVNLFRLVKMWSILSEERFSLCEVTSPWGLTVQLSDKEIIYMYIFITMLSHKLQQAILKIPYRPCTINECVLLLNTAIYVSFKVG